MPGSASDEKEKSDGGFSGLMGDLKDKLQDTKLHDLKISLHHKKFVSASSGPCPPAGGATTLRPFTTEIKLESWGTW